MEVLSDVELEKLSVDSTDWALCNGLVMFSKKTGALVAAPYTLFPTKYPAANYKKAVALATHFNSLVDAVAADHKFLEETLAGTEDSFTQSLLKIFRKVNAEGVKQKVTLGIHRSDYMLDTVTGSNQISLKQVEINTIAASFSNLSTVVSKLHRFFIERTESLHAAYSVDKLVVNESQEHIPAAIAKAWELYGNSKAVAVMIVHPGETNTFDQRMLEFKLWNGFKVRMIRRTLADFAQRATLDGQSRMSIDGTEVAVVYFRAGYNPDDYPTDQEWTARELIERSLAIKNPTVAYQLAGTKKVQQVLALSGMLEKYVKDPEAATLLRSCFAGLYSLSEQEDAATVKETVNKAIAHPERYVMKPQREGGGNNLYSDNLKHALETMPSNERSAYILMDRIVPPEYPAIFVREGKIHKATASSELGIYSVFVKNGDNVEMNSSGGYLLRTKISNVDDGGVAAGVAVLDSLYLVD